LRYNQQHIAECLAEFDPARHLARAPEALELALWFHDAVYDPAAGDNEERSAELAKSCLAEARVSGDIAEIVSRLILATKKHEDGADPDVSLMIDVDLSILGREPNRFLEYEEGIRREYSWVPSFLFTSKRNEILEGFLARERIFRTAWFYEKYEAAARRNLESSLQKSRRDARK